VSAEATGAVWRSSPYRGVLFTIQLAIADVVNDVHDNELWMSATSLATKARASRSTTMEALLTLERDGVIERLDKRGRKATGKPVRWRWVWTPGVSGERTGVSGERTGGVRSGDTPTFTNSKELKPTRASRAGSAVLRDWKPDPSFDADFDLFWKLYPRSEGKITARWRFEVAIALHGLPAVMAGTQRYVQDPNLPPPTYCPHAATWLHQQRYLDTDPLPPRGRGGGDQISEEELVRRIRGGADDT
jgi:hypothetical protein